VPIIRGRALARNDLETPSASAIVNEAFVRRYFGSTDPLGKRVQAGNESLAVVGVVRDFRQDRPPAPIAPALYTYHRFYPGGQTLVVRTSLENPLALVPSVRAIVRELDPTLVAYMSQTMDQAVARGLWRQRLQARVLEIFAVLAVVLATFGIYGVISYTVAQRTHEVGLRMALGATRRDVVSLVIKESAGLCLLGVALGLATSLVVTRFLKTLLYGIQANDMMTFAVASALIVLIAVMASLVPALRASEVDPLIALRSE
jgi:putative ABC transport system permease protein